MPLACLTWALAASIATGITFNKNGARRTNSNYTSLEHRQPDSADIEDIVFVSHRLPLKDEVNDRSSEALDRVEEAHEKAHHTISRFFNREDTENALRKDKEMEQEEDDKYRQQIERIIRFGRGIEETFGVRINWFLFKIVVGVLLILPVIPKMLIWESKGNPPHPFILAEEAVPTWPAWAYDLGQIMALIGVDVILLAGIEWHWHTAMVLFRIFSWLRAFQGFVVFVYGVVRKHGSAFKGKENKIGPVTIIAENKFQDFTTSPVHLVLVIAAQMTFMAMYLYEMEKPMPITPRAYVYWMAAIPMQVVARGLMGRSFCHECTYWHTMLHIHHTDVIKVGAEDDEDQARELKLLYPSVILRAIMSFYVNNISMAWIAMSLPVFTMSAPTDIDFVKDCFAIVFITTLDDLADNVTMTIQRLRGLTSGALQRLNTAPAPEV